VGVWIVKVTCVLFWVYLTGVQIELPVNYQIKYFDYLECEPCSESTRATAAPLDSAIPFLSSSGSLALALQCHLGE
jgi:hypothetical protein